MSITPKDFLESAQELLGRGSEAAWRNATSRAYYAAFHYCKPLHGLLDAPIDVKGGSHLKFIAAFKNSANHKVRTIGYQLQQLHSARVRADYHIDLSFTKGAGETAIVSSKRIMADVDASS